MSNTDSSADRQPTSSRGNRSRAGLFDIRNIIGALILIYGVVLVLASFGTSDEQKARADGVNANLWVGLGMIVFGALMLVWAVTRPIVVDEDQVAHDKQEAEHEGHGPA